MRPIKIVFLGLLFGFSIRSYGQKYIPILFNSVETSEVVLEYSDKAGAQRPWAHLKFRDGFEIHLNAVCEGDYAWCMRVFENDKMIELGSLKIKFHKRRNLAVLKTRITNVITRYKKYLDVVPGKYKKVRQE